MTNNFKTIEIDLDVYKHLTNALTNANETYNDILRKILGLDRPSPLPVNQGIVTNSSIKVQAIVNHKKGVVATGYPVAGGFRVLKGSTISRIEDPSCPDLYKNIRRDLFSNGILNSKYEFTQDYVFTSISNAASVVLGGSRNGLRTWEG